MWIFPEANQKEVFYTCVLRCIIIDYYFDAVTDINGYASIVVVYQNGINYMGIVKAQISFIIAEVNKFCYVSGKWKLSYVLQNF